VIGRQFVSEIGQQLGKLIGKIIRHDPAAVAL